MLLLMHFKSTMRDERAFEREGERVFRNYYMTRDVVAAINSLSEIVRLFCIEREREYLHQSNGDIPLQKKHLYTNINVQ